MCIHSIPLLSLTYRNTRDSPHAKCKERVLHFPCVWEGIARGGLRTSVAGTALPCTRGQPGRPAGSARGLSGRGRTTLFRTQRVGRKLYSPAVGECAGRWQARHAGKRAGRPGVESLNMVLLPALSERMSFRYFTKSISVCYYEYNKFLARCQGLCAGICPFSR
jgi:hypothetical protein